MTVEKNHGGKRSSAPTQPNSNTESCIITARACTTGLAIVESTSAIPKLLVCRRDHPMMNVMTMLRIMKWLIVEYHQKRSLIQNSSVQIIIIYTNA